MRRGGRNGLARSDCFVEQNEKKHSADAAGRRAARIPPLPALQKTMPPHPATTLTTWLSHAGVTLSPSIAVVPDGKGVRVVATAPLAPGTRLATLPPTAVLSAAASCIGPQLEAAHIGGGLALVMAVAAETARGRASRWAGYLSTLPPGGERVPLLWLQDGRGDETIALGLLQGTDAAGRAGADAEAVDDDWHSIAAPFAATLPPPLRFTAPHFTAAATWVGSRAFGVGGGHGQALVPLADAFNHKASVVEVRGGGSGGRRLVVDGACMAEEEEGSSSEDEEEDEESDDDDDDDAPPADDATPAAPPIAPPRPDGLALQLVICGDDDEGGGLTLYTASAVKAGFEIFNTYGELPNRDLLPKYGVCLAANPFDAVAVPAAALLEAAAEAVGARAVRARARLLSRDTDLLDGDDAGLDVTGPGGASTSGPMLSGALRLVARVLFDDSAGWASAADAAAPCTPPPLKRRKPQPLGPVSIAQGAAADPPLTSAAAAGVAAALRKRLGVLRATEPHTKLSRPSRAVAAALTLRQGEAALLTAAIEAAERVAQGKRED